jgi:endo-1,4-beta-mannosidase
MDRFLLGVNYWPRSSAMAMWSRFDLGEIDEDFARIAALGLDVVRFFLLWEAFAPVAGSIDALALNRFVDVLDRAHAHGLRTMPTLFCGHMSGVNWLPAWTLDPATPSGRFRTIASGKVSPYGIGDFYTGGLLEAQRTFARAAGERARDHASVLAWDLGNEFSNLRAPRTPQDAAQWSKALTHDLLETSNIGVTGGTHGEDLSEDRNIRLSSLAEPWAFATMHGYPAYSDFAQSLSDPEVVPFLHEMAAAFARKPVLFSEFGTPATALDDDAAAQYAREVLPRLQRRSALGAFWWCWTDYAPELASSPPFDLAPHELRFGIVRADGSERPVAAALADFARERRTVAEAAPPAINEESYYAGLPASLREAYAKYCARYGDEGASG